MQDHDVTPTVSAGSRQRSDGIRSREAILREAAQLVTLEGIDGLSIGRLAEAVGMSKSGLFAHFRSKEELQLATIDKAEALFRAEVVDPALAAGSGLTRLHALCEEFLGHLVRGVFPGGCFFASVAAELDTHPGPVRDRALTFVSYWFELLVASVADAQAEGAIDPAEDPRQVAFELDAYLLLANAQFVATRDLDAIERCRRAIARLLPS